MALRGMDADSNDRDIYLPPCVDQRYSMSFTVDERPEVNAGRRPNDRTATVKYFVDRPGRPVEPAPPLAFSPILEL
jgi:hypothetical protein